MDKAEELIKEFLHNLQRGVDIELDIIALRDKKFQLLKDAGKGRGIHKMAQELDITSPGEVLLDKKPDLDEIISALNSIKKINEAIRKLFEREILFHADEIEQLKNTSLAIDADLKALSEYYASNSSRIPLGPKDSALLQNQVQRAEEEEKRKVLAAVNAIRATDRFLEKFAAVIINQVRHIEKSLSEATKIWGDLVHGKPESKMDIAAVKEGIRDLIIEFRGELSFYRQLAANDAAKRKIFGELVRTENRRQELKFNMSAGAKKGKLRVLIVPCNWGFGPVSKAVGIVNILAEFDNVLEAAAILASPDICNASKRGYSRIKSYPLDSSQLYDRTENINYKIFGARVANFVKYFEKTVRDFRPNLIIDSLGYITAPLARTYGITVIKIDHLFPELTAHQKDQDEGEKLLRKFLEFESANLRIKFLEELIKTPNLRAFQWLGNVLADYLIISSYLPIEVTRSVWENRMSVWQGSLGTLKTTAIFVNPTMNGNLRTLLENSVEVKSRIGKILERINKGITGKKITKTILVNTGGIFNDQEHPSGRVLFEKEISALAKAVVQINKKNSAGNERFGIFLVGSLGESERINQLMNTWTKDMQECMVIAGNLRFDNIIRCYLSADVVVTNAGQTSISELICLNKPFLLLSPYQTEMLRNTKYIVGNKLGLFLPNYLDKNRNPTSMLESVLIELSDSNSKLFLDISKRLTEAEGKMEWVDNVLVRVLNEMGYDVSLRFAETKPKPDHDSSTMVSVSRSLPLISIIIPCFNTSQYLNGLMKSIVMQTYKNVEVIVVDDGSTESSSDKNFAKLAAEYPFIKIIRYKQNVNANYARNKGFEASKGQYLFFCDSDVILYDSCLEDLMKALGSNLNCSFAYSNFDREAEDAGLERHRTLAHISGHFDVDKLREQNYIDTVSLIKRDAFPGFDPFIQRHQDWDLFLTLASLSKVGAWVNKSLFKSIQRKESISGRGVKDRNNSRHIILTKHGLLSLKYKAKYAIIIPTHNQEDKTIRCLQSIKDNSHVDFNIYWVDDDSEPQSRAKVSAFLDSIKIPHTKIYKNGQDRGFIGSVNLALKKIERDGSFTHFIILNNDIVLTRGWIDKLFYPMTVDNKIMATGPVTSKAAWQTPKGIEKVFNISLPPYNLSHKEWDIESYNMMLARNTNEHFKYTTVLSFFCTFFNINLIKKIGILDPRFGMGYADDDDYCLRIIKGGFKIAVCLDTFVYHDHGTSFNAIGKRNELIGRNHRIFVEKWGHRPMQAREFNPALIQPIQPKPQIPSIPMPPPAQVPIRDYRRI